MPHFKDFVPQGVIPATLLAFHDDLSINEKETRRHLSFVAATDGITAITINGHASEVHACSFEDQQRLLAMAGDEIGDKIPLIGGIYADGSFEAAKLAKMHERGGASALLCFPPNSFGMGGIQRRPEMAFAHFQTIAAATDLPLIIFQYSNELAYDLDTLVKLSEIIPSIRAVKDWSPAQRHERNIRVLQNLSRPINVLTTNSAWLMSALSMGAKGLLSGAGSVIADLQVALFDAVQTDDFRRAKDLAARIWYTSEVFYADPFGDMHNRMKEALVLLGRLDKAIVRPPLVKVSNSEIARIGAALRSAGIERNGASGLRRPRIAAE